MSDVDRPEDTAFGELLDRITQDRGVDVGAYKLNSLRRRIDKRIAEVGINGYAAYNDHLDANPDEFVKLFDTITINVTQLFRDPDAWLRLRDDVIPRIVARSGETEHIRVWSVGCSTGEEVYSLAMLFADALGADRYRSVMKIYGTDIDEEALAVARTGAYPADVAPAHLPADLAALIEVHMETGADGRVVSRDLRRAVIFGRHDILRDAPISRVDLICCRNTLMYFNREAQRGILERFHFALREKGYLFLGRAETLSADTTRFQQVDLASRIFIRNGVPARAPVRAAGSVPHAVLDDAVQSLRHMMFVGGPLAQLAIDADGRLVLANARARALFHLGDADIGRPFSDLELSYRPVELRSLIDEATREGRVVNARAELPAAGAETRFLEFQIQPLTDTRRRSAGTAIWIMDATEHHHLEVELQASTRDVASAYEELQAANEELETTNEELQSTVEELETTNEELQSTNEELVAMNAEMQSTNEDLKTANAALSDRTDELDAAKEHLEAILSSLEAGVAVVNPDLTIRLWNGAAEDLWGLRADELQGTSFITMDTGLPVAGLEEPLREVLRGRSGREQRVLEAHDRRGRPLRCRVTLSPLDGGPPGPPTGAVIVMERLATS